VAEIGGVDAFDVFHVDCSQVVIVLASFLSKQPQLYTANQYYYYFVNCVNFTCFRDITTCLVYVTVSDFEQSLNCNNQDKFSMILKSPADTVHTLCLCTMHHTAVIIIIMLNTKNCMLQVT